MGAPHQPEKCEAVFGSADARKIPRVEKPRVSLARNRCAGSKSGRTRAISVLSASRYTEPVRLCLPPNPVPSLRTGGPVVLPDGRVTRRLSSSTRAGFAACGYRPDAVCPAEAYSRGLTCLQALVSNEPTNGQAWAALAVIYFHQRLYGIGLPTDLAADINKRSEFGQRSLEAALKAVDLLPNDGFARKTLANAYYVTCQRDRIRIESQRAVDLSPNDPSVLGPLGTFLAFSGDWDAGAALVERAIDLIAPANPRWWWRSLGDREWLRGEYQQAYDLFQRSYVEQNWVSHMELAKTLPFLGRTDEARAEIVTIRRMKANFSIRDVRDYLHSWCFADDYITRVEATLHDVGLTE
jgi:Flp pilus assembly protein TadD